MAGTYRLLKSGKWELAVRLGTDLSGKPIRRYKYVEASGPREVEKILAEFVTECTRTDYESGSRMTLKEFSDLYMRDYGETNLRIRTRERYKTVLPRILEALGHKKLCDLKPTHLIQFYTMLTEDGIRQDGKTGGLSTETIRRHQTVLQSMFARAVEWQILKENICKRAKIPKPTRAEAVRKEEQDLQIYTIDQTIQLILALSNADVKYRVLVLLAIFTGFRRGELMGVEWKDINLKERSINLKRTSLYAKDQGVFEDTTKTPKAKRTVYLPDFIVAVLNEYKVIWNSCRVKAKDRWVETDRLFIQWNGEPMHPDTPSSWFPKFLVKNKLPHMPFKGLRHLHGSILLAMGMDLESVADQLGHATTQMVINVYGHNVKRKNKEVADTLAKALLKPFSENGGVNGGIN
jgi:integrase